MQVASRNGALLDAFVAGLPCRSTLILSYELLTTLPHVHAAPLAAFLGVNSSHPYVADLLRNIYRRRLQLEQLPLPPRACEHQLQTLASLGGKLAACPADARARVLPEELSALSVGSTNFTHGRALLRWVQKAVAKLPTRFPNAFPAVAVEAACDWQT